MKTARVHEQDVCIVYYFCCPTDDVDEDADVQMNVDHDEAQCAGLHKFKQLLHVLYTHKIVLLHACMVMFSFAKSVLVSIHGN